MGTVGPFILRVYEISPKKKKQVMNKMMKKIEMKYDNLS